MRRAAVGAAPALLLRFQPFCYALPPDHLHVLQYALMIGPLRICHERMHFLAGIQIGAFVTKRITLAAGAGFDAAGRTVSGRLLAFAAITWVGLCACFRSQHDRAGTAIQTAISIEYEIHERFSP